MRFIFATTLRRRARKLKIRCSKTGTASRTRWWARSCENFLISDNAFVYKKLHEDNHTLKMLHRALYVREQPEVVPRPFSKPRDTLIGRRDTI